MFRLDLFSNRPTPVQPIQAEIDRARGEVNEPIQNRRTTFLGHEALRCLVDGELL